MEPRCFFGGVAKKMKKPRGSHKENLSAGRKRLALKAEFFFLDILLFGVYAICYNNFWEICPL